MKNLAFALLAGGMLAATGLKAQTIDDVVKKHNEAVGGVKAWQKVSSIVYKGSMNANGAEINITKSILAGKGMRTDIDFMGQKGFSIITPTKGWAFFPFGGQTKPEEMPADDVKNSQDELQVMDELMNFKERGGKVELAGKEQIDGKDAFKVIYTDKDAVATTFFVDASTYFIVRQVSAAPAGAPAGGDVTTNLSNYKKLPEGITVPMTMGSSNGDVTLTKVEVNTIKDEKMFSPVANGG